MWTELTSMIWIERRKAIRSGLPLWTTLGSLFMPLGIAFLIFVARNPEITQKLGLIGAKANLLAYSSTDWPAYLIFFGQMIAAGGFFLFILATSWVFGREFADGTVKDLLAVPVRRGSILLAKFIVTAAWDAALALVIVIAGLVTGAAIQLPGGSFETMLNGVGLLLGTTGLTIVAVMPFAFFASVGRGYLLPVGLAVLAIMSANLAIVLGWGEYFPWAVAGLFMMEKNSLSPISYWIVYFTGLAGMAATYLWWKHADQSS